MSNGQSILLVDDDHEYGRAMRKMLERSGYDVTIARDGQEAMDILSVIEIDLVISEVRTPQLNGIDMMEEINRSEIDASVIFLTAYGDVESYMDLMNMGAFDYLNKPVKKREILSVVKRALGTYGEYGISLK